MKHKQHERKRLNMQPSEYFLLLGAIYMAPHFGEKLGTFLGFVSIVLGTIIYFSSILKS